MTASAAADGPANSVRQPRGRVEARDKVTGRARYAGDLGAAEIGQALDVAVAVTSDRSCGRIAAIDDREALAVPGVRVVLTHRNAPRLRKPLALGGGETEGLVPLQDDRIRYSGQCVAVVVAETLAAATEAARRVRITYEAGDAAQAFTLAQAGDRLRSVRRAGIAPGKVRHGDAEAAYAGAQHRVDLAFSTAPHHHNAMEPGAVIACWDSDGGLTLHLPTQWNHATALAIGQAFRFGLMDRLPGFLARIFGGVTLRGKVRVRSTLAGGAFGRNNHMLGAVLAPLAARVNGRPVKLVLTREQTFSLTPYRGETRQRVRLGADGSGRIVALVHDADVATGIGGSFVEPVGEVSGQVYAAGTILVRHRVAELDLNAPGWMRAPGGAVALFAIESAMDELAGQVGMDPLDFRLANHADRDPQSGKPWSSKSLKACYEAAAERIGWRRRPPPGSRCPRTGHLVGYGMATSLHPNRQFPGSAAIRLERGGGAVVSTAVAEMGQGTLTALTELAAAELGLARERVALAWGDSALPLGAPSFGSAGLLSAGDAVSEAARKVRRALFAHAVRDRASPLYGQEPRGLRVEGGRVVGTGGAAEEIAALLARHPTGRIEARATTGRTMGYDRRFAKAAFGAQFARVSVDPATMAVRVERLVGAFACGRIVNARLAASQLRGGMVWGIGQALFEETSLDDRTGRWMGCNLAEALVPTHADVGDVEVILVEEDDTRAHPLGIKGVGEIGLVGTAAAIANAIHDATGRRLRALPMRVEHLLAEDGPPVAGS